ncbi:adhesive domain-containing protein [Planococcus sp. 1R117A]|uniref:adhesive domain-containing protein n=1 Tax=Planococcus sp. 1R117A TaxID=3447020 RepID=UPI003EDBDE76
MKRRLKFTILITLLLFVFYELRAPLLVEAIGDANSASDEMPESEYDLSSVEPDSKTPADEVSEAELPEEEVPELIAGKPDEDGKLQDETIEPEPLPEEPPLSPAELPETPAPDENLEEPVSSEKPPEEPSQSQDELPEPAPPDETLEEPVLSEKLPEEQASEKEPISAPETLPAQDDLPQQELLPELVSEQPEPPLEETMPVEPQAAPQPKASGGLLDVGLLTNTTLKASSIAQTDGRQTVKLNYSGRSILNLNLLENTYVIFSLPPELAALADAGNMTASFDVPLVSLLGIEVGRSLGSFQTGDIQLIGNQVVINTRGLISLGLISTYRFELAFTIDAFPPAAEQNEYVFYAQATRQIVDVSLLEQNLARGVLTVPASGILEFKSVPETIAFKETQIGNGMTTIERTHPEQGIIVSDTRGNGSDWIIHAHINRPLTSTSSAHALPEALKFIDSSGHARPLNDAALEVHHGITGTSADTTVAWPRNHGLVIELDTMEARPETYSTEITWTLVDAP